MITPEPLPRPQPKTQQPMSIDQTMGGVQTQPEEYNEYLRKVARGQDVVQTVRIKTLPGRISRYHTTSDVALADRSKSVTGETQDTEIQKDFGKWAVQSARDYYGLGAEDIIYLNDQLVQESSFTPEQQAIAGQVWSGRMSALASYQQEQARVQDELKFQMQDTARTKELIEQGRLSELKGSLSQFTVDGKTFATYAQAEQYTKGLQGRQAVPGGVQPVDTSAPGPGEYGYHAVPGRPEGLYQIRPEPVVDEIPISFATGYGIGLKGEVPANITRSPINVHELSMYPIKTGLEKYTTRYTEGVYGWKGIVEAPDYLKESPVFQTFHGYGRSVLAGVGQLPQFAADIGTGTELFIRQPVESAKLVPAGLGIMAGGVVSEPKKAAGELTGLAIATMGVGMLKAPSIKVPTAKMFGDTPQLIKEQFTIKSLSRPMAEPSEMAMFGTTRGAVKSIIGTESGIEMPPATFRNMFGDTGRLIKARIPPEPIDVKPLPPPTMRNMFGETKQPPKIDLRKEYYEKAVKTEEWQNYEYIKEAGRLDLLERKYPTPEPKMEKGIRQVNLEKDLIKPDIDLTAPSQKPEVFPYGRFSKLMDRISTPKEKSVEMPRYRPMIKAEPPADFPFDIYGGEHGITAKPGINGGLVFVGSAVALSSIGTAKASEPVKVDTTARGNFVKDITRDIAKNMKEQGLDVEVKDTSIIKKGKPDDILVDVKGFNAFKEESLGPKKFRDKFIKDIELTGQDILSVDFGKIQERQGVGEIPISSGKQQLIAIQRQEVKPTLSKERTIPLTVPILPLQRDFTVQTPKERLRTTDVYGTRYEPVQISKLIPVKRGVIVQRQDYGTAPIFKQDYGLSSIQSSDQGFKQIQKEIQQQKQTLVSVPVTIGKQRTITYPLPKPYLKSMKAKSKKDESYFRTFRASPIAKPLTGLKNLQKELSRAFKPVQKKYKKSKKSQKSKKKGELYEVGYT